MIRDAIMAVKAHRIRASNQRWLASEGLTALNRPLMEHFGDRVVSGPFRGLRLTPRCCQEHIGPVLLGTYENELHGVIEDAIARAPTRVLDIGAKIGYYAVGLAKRLPTTPVEAFDTDWWARKATREVATLNAQENVATAGACTPRRLAAVQPRSLIVCDIDGAEVPLFTARPLPALATATLLIETHDGLVADTTRTLTDRFAPTHDVLEIPCVWGHKTPPVDLSAVFPGDIVRQQKATVEPRCEGQSWLYCTPKREVGP